MGYKDNFKNYQKDEVSLFSLISTLKRERNLIFLTTLLSSILVMSYAYRTKPIWLGQFNIVVKDNSEKSFNPLANLGIGSNTDEKTTQLIILKSPSVLLPVYENTKQFYEKNNVNKIFSYKSWVNNKLNIKYEQGSQVLSISYRDKDKEHIIDTLNMISKKYKDYSKKSRKENLSRTIKYLNEQKNIMKIKSLNSQKEFNKFSIENGLGTIDGFVGLGKETDAFLSKNNLDRKAFLNNSVNSNSIQTQNNFSFNTDALQLEDEVDEVDEVENSDAGIRYRQQFLKLEKLESEYIELSSILKPESNTIKELKTRIETFRNALKKPNEILIKYKLLSKKAKRDEKILSRIENKLEFYNLEQINIPNPWEMISKPTIDLIIYPNKKLFLFSSIIFSFIFGSIIAFIKQNKENLIYEKEDFEKLINCDYIETLNNGEIKLNNELILNLLSPNKDKLEKNQLIGIIYFKNTNLNNLFKLKDKNFEIKNNFEDFDIKKFDRISLIIDSGSLNYEDIDKINKYLYLCKEKIVGWFFVNSSIK